MFRPLDLKDILRERERKAASGTPTPPASAREPPKRGNDIRAIYKEHIPPVPLWKAPYGDTFDLVQRHGMQLRDVAQRIVERARSLDGWTTMYNRWSRFERDHIAPQDVDVLVRWGRLVHSVRSPVQLATRSARAGEKAAAAAADADDAGAILKWILCCFLGFFGLFFCCFVGHILAHSGPFFDSLTHFLLTFTFWAHSFFSCRGECRAPSLLPRRRSYLCERVQRVPSVARPR